MKEFILRNPTLLILAALLIAAPRPCSGQGGPLEGAWTGGFWLRGAWVAVNLRVAADDDSARDTADLLFPSYGGGENRINVAVEDLKQGPDGAVHFEVPARTGRVVFDGRHEDASITGNFVYGKSRGASGLTRWAFVPVETLQKYYGAYRLSSDRVISILRGWGHPRTLNFVDYETGQVGTLWPSSETEFYSGEGLSVSYPIALRVSFDRDATGNVTGLSWQAGKQAGLTARKLAFEEERLTCRNGEVTIGGTLISPAGEGRYPAVIVAPGDYGTNRDQLRLWAHNYPARGVAAFIFDARGSGESTGSLGGNSFSDLADDVLACVRTLQTHRRVRSDAIGLFGFSNSAFTVSLAASRSTDVAFLILQSLVGVVAWRQELHRAETQLRVDGFPQSVVRKGADFMRLKFEVARTGEGWERLQAVMEQASDERWLPYTNPPRSLERMRQSYRNTMTYDPVPALEKLKMPVLAIWGGRDTYLPVSETVTSFKRAMAKAGNKDYVAKVYPTGDHSLMVSEKGSPSTGGKEKNFLPGLWEFKADWLLKRIPAGEKR